jgi:hypothetical protein
MALGCEGMEQRVLDGPPRIPCLHLTEIRNEEWRTTHGISFNESQERISEAVRVMYSSGSLSAIAGVIKRSELVAAMHSRFTNKKKFPSDWICQIIFALWLIPSSLWLKSIRSIQVWTR